MSRSFLSLNGRVDLEKQRFRLNLIALPHPAEQAQETKRIIVGWELRTALQQGMGFERGRILARFAQ